MVKGVGVAAFLVALALGSGGVVSEPVAPDGLEAGIVGLQDSVRQASNLGETMAGKVVERGAIREILDPSQEVITAERSLGESLGGSIRHLAIVLQRDLVARAHGGRVGG